MFDCLVMILAGGRGERLKPLTDYRSKPAVPFGGKYRIIDFVLSNFVNSGYYRQKVITQFKSNSLLVHLNRAWNIGGILDHHYIHAVPAQMQVGDMWYQGTADAIYQNINLMEDEQTRDVAVFGGDHIYKMDIRQMHQAHQNNNADLTVCARPYPRKDSTAFGCIKTDDQGRIVGFVEKPKDPPPIPGREELSYVSMGNYFFKSEVLKQVLFEDAYDTNSAHDFGKNIIPKMVADGYRVFAYDFSSNKVPGEASVTLGYWRDVGSLYSYFNANMELRSVSPVMNLYNREWPIRTSNSIFGPVKFVFAEAGGRYGQAIDSIVGDGSIISGSTVINSVVFSNCFIHSYAHVSDCILMSGCDIGRNSVLKKVICDKNVTIEPGNVIGFSPEKDRERFFVSEEGLIVIPKNSIVPKEGAVRTFDPLDVHAHELGRARTFTPEGSLV